MVKPLPRLKLQGFNNLTKALSFNIYDMSYAVTNEQRDRYIEYIDEAYNAERLTQILTDVADIIGANILNVARQDYDPQGASVTILISEHPIVEKIGKDVIPETVLAHLDKSHITVHTYPETHPEKGISHVILCTADKVTTSSPPPKTSTAPPTKHTPTKTGPRVETDRPAEGGGPGAGLLAAGGALLALAGIGAVVLDGRRRGEHR